jgi:class 3 adenylate cyclase/tetratricopeptide (TPR) repeat protein
MAANMRCAKCGTESKTGRKFCANCGNALAIRCPKCGAENEPSSKFCEDCGAALAPVLPNARVLENPPQRQPEIHFAAGADDSAGALDGERKTVTALFADIKGSMELMEDLDPEEARAIVDPALNLMIDATRRYGGYVVQSTGDGIFALFGAPIAHEDHPQRALYAALRMQEEMRRYAARLRERGTRAVEARLGVNTGEVVVRLLPTGEGHLEYTPIGHSTSLAARMQGLAPTGSIAVTQEVEKWCRGYFIFKPLGLTRVRGVSEPIDVYEVTGLGPLRTRLQRAAGRGLTKFVGREHEMETLRDAAERAKEGRGQLVAVMADPGVGKSRLFYEFKATSQSGWLVLETLSISHGKASAFLPVIDLLRNYFEISATDDERKRREKVVGKITVLDRSLEDTLPYLFSLLAIVEGEDALAQTDGQIKKRRTLEAIKRILLRESLKQPLMVVFEDLHWMDGESEALLNLLADSIGTSRVLLLANYRPEYRHQWGSKTYYTQLRLDPLGKESADEMLTALLGNDASIVPLKRLIGEKTEGNPLFMEEIVLNLFEDGALARNGEVKLAKPLASLLIPATVQGILASRIDRLPADEKDLLQTVAVIGTEFNLAVARALSGKSDDDLNRMLNDLQLAEFIYERPAAGEAEYTFKHALTQEVAYRSILVERRKNIHENAAQAIESLYAAKPADHYEDLAHHYSRSGNALKAANYLQLAAEQAMNRSAYAEATTSLSTALEFLRRQPDKPDRDRAELAVRLSLAVCMMLSMRVGLVSPAVVEMLERAHVLCAKVGDERTLFQILENLSFQHGGPALKGELSWEKVHSLDDQLLNIALRIDDPAVLGRARFARGRTLLWEGNFTAAGEEFTKASQLSTVVSSEPELSLGDWRVRNYSLAAFALWILGYPEKAISSGSEALSIARRTTSPADLVFALNWSVTLNLRLRNAKIARLHNDETVALVSEHGLTAFKALTGFWRAQVLTQVGEMEEGLSQMLRTGSELGHGVVRPLISAGLAEVFLATCRPSDGLEAVNEGLAFCQRSGTRTLESDLLRLKGESLLMADQSAQAEAEQCFREAITVARSQSAKSWELRATMSLARLLAKQGRHAEARAMLAEIYNWFTEGFDTADLKDAKALLAQMGN